MIRLILDLSLNLYASEVFVQHPLPDKEIRSRKILADSRLLPHKVILLS